VPEVARWLGQVVWHSGDGCAPKVGLEVGVAAVEGRKLRLGLAEGRGGDWGWWRSEKETCKVDRGVGGVTVTGMGQCR
jgi:hypothetical protein